MPLTGGHLSRATRYAFPTAPCKEIDQPSLLRFFFFSLSLFLSCSLPHPNERFPPITNVEIQELEGEENKRNEDEDENGTQSELNSSKCYCSITLFHRNTDKDE